MLEFWVRSVSLGGACRHGMFSVLAFSNLALGKLRSFSREGTPAKPVSMVTGIFVLSLFGAGADMAGSVIPK